MVDKTINQWTGETGISPLESLKNAWFRREKDIVEVFDLASYIPHLGQVGMLIDLKRHSLRVW